MRQVFCAFVLSIGVALPAIAQVSCETVSEIAAAKGERFAFKNAPARDAGSVVVAHAQMLQRVERRLTAAAFIRPVVGVCDFPGINALAIGSKNLIVLSVDMLGVIQEDESLAAFVLAHEIAHLKLGHGGVQANVNQVARQQGRVIGTEHASASGNKAEGWFVEGLAATLISRKVSRDLEDEADAAGFQLYVLAGFDPAALPKALRLLMSYTGNKTDDPYLSTHPDMELRVAILQRRAAEESQKQRFVRQTAEQADANRAYRSRADAMLDSQAYAELTGLVDSWLGQMPESGQAWYFRAKLMQRKHGTSNAVMDALEKAVTFDPGSSEAWEAYCVGLFRRGYKLESAHCSRFIRGGELAERYRAQTFRDSLTVGGSPRAAPSNLWVSRNSSGGKLLTNDEALLNGGAAKKPVPAEWHRMYW